MQDLDNVLYEILRYYRNAIFTQYDHYYPNRILERLAKEQPQNKEDFLKIAEDEEQFRAYGYKFLDIIKVISSFSTSVSPLEQQVKEKLKHIELTLYNYIIKKLQLSFGDDWWFRGIPIKIRIKAAQLHEESNGDISKEKALYLVDLVEIILNNWDLFKDEIDPNNHGKKAFKSKMQKINDLRNRISHPTRLQEHPITEKDFRQLNEYSDFLNNIN